MANHQIDIVVVGAGAAGLAAGIFAAEACVNTTHDKGLEPAIPSAQIVVLDGANRIGAKIMISGGGRCNVTNEAVSANDFNGLKPVVRNILAAFDENATSRWFESLGVPLKREESGKVFPVTDKARTVLDALTGRCRHLGVDIRTEHRVMEITSASESERGSACSPGFIVRHERGEIRARRVVMATGGQSLPGTGSDGSGWEIARRLGHTVTSTHPALVPLVLHPSMFHAELSGLSQEVELTTIVNGKRVDRRTGSMLWTHTGISGPVVMDCSRFWTTAKAAGYAVDLRCHFWPGAGFEQVDRWLVSQREARPKLSLGKLVAQQVPERVAGALCRWSGIDPGTPVGQLSSDCRRRVVHAITHLPLPVERDRGWNYAEVTAGGVPLNEIDFRTMESRKVPDLYLIGEMLDCDGRIGGFNFQWAWATGYLGGRGAVGSPLSRTGLPSADLRSS
ncbi:MAG: NAD(P)/FAD-dependent oxidoreductase [Nitrospiraceae bacterium]